MIRKIRPAAQLLVALFAMLAAVAAPAAAQATPPKPVSASYEVSCGKVVVTVVNTTKWAFSADVRLDDEPGVDDMMTGKVIAGGPHKGKPFGQRYNPLDVPAGQTVTRTVTVPEDSGDHVVAWRVWRGPENDFYLFWVELAGVDSDCQPNPTSTPTPDPTETASPAPSGTAAPGPDGTGSPVPSTSPDGAVSGGGQLPLTGSPVLGATVLGAALVIAGGAVLVVRRRRTRYEA